MRGEDPYWISLAEMKGFSRDAGDVFTAGEMDALYQYLAVNPLAGDVIPGTGGIRKLRWGARSQGKRSGARVIYYFRDLNMPVYLLALYIKGEKVNLSEGEKRIMRRLTEELVKEHAVRWHRIRVVPDGAA